MEKKDTASKLRPESQRPGFSVRGQKPLRMVGMESHDAQSAGEKKTEFIKAIQSANQSCASVKLTLLKKKGNSF